jgi:hypothetical protein
MIRNYSCKILIMTSQCNERKALRGRCEKRNIIWQHLRGISRGTDSRSAQQPSQRILRGNLSNLTLRTKLNIFLRAFSCSTLACIFCTILPRFKTITRKINSLKQNLTIKISKCWTRVTFSLRMWKETACNCNRTKSNCGFKIYFYNLRRSRIII